MKCFIGQAPERVKPREKKKCDCDIEMDRKKRRRELRANSFVPGYAANAFYPQLCQNPPILLLPVPLDRFIVGIKIEEECNCWVNVLTHSMMQRCLLLNAHIFVFCFSAD